MDLSGVVLTPVAALAITNLRMQTADKQRLVGLLVGATVKGVVEIRNVLPFDLEFIRHNARSAPGERAVGWVVDVFEQADLQRTLDTLGKHITKPLYMSAQLPREGYCNIAFRAFVPAKFQCAESDVTFFKELRVTLAASDNATNIAVDTLVRQFFPGVSEAANPCQVSMVTNNDATVVRKNILANLQIATQYVKDVTSGKKKGDKKVGRALSQALGYLRYTEALDAATEASVHEALALKYLMKVLRTQFDSRASARSAAVE